MTATAHPIICFSAVDWDYITMREHQLLSRLARYYPVLYVEEQSHLLSLARSPRKVRKMWRWTHPPRQVAENVWVYTPPMTLPFGRILSNVNDVNQRILTGQVRRAARTLGFAEPILWFYEPEQYRQIGRFGERLVVYDCVDKHDAFARLQRPALVREMEARLCARADIVFVVSDALKRAVVPDRSFVVPNGADLVFFSKALGAATGVARELESLRTPIIGYVGVIDTWVDVDLVAQAAGALPQYSFVLVGPVRAGARKLKGLSNVHLVGRQPYQMLPHFLKGFDACLLPFRLTPLTLAASPIKLYEYLAAGKVVVATDLPEARRFRLGVFVARSPEEFVQLVKEAPSSNLSSQEIASQMEHESWGARVAAMHRALQAHLASTREGTPLS